MSMEHKAFLFDHSRFEAELGKTLHEALQSGNIKELVRFIEINVNQLKDPYEGAPLDLSWDDLLETRDAHQYGDFALTKFYEPEFDLGLGSDWALVERGLTKSSDVAPAFILGRPFGPAQNLFDPGKMGSYFLSAEEVKKKSAQLRTLMNKASLCELLPGVVQVFRKAADSGKGLYTTF